MGQEVLIADPLCPCNNDVPRIGPVSECHECARLKQARDEEREACGSIPDHHYKIDSERYPKQCIHGTHRYQDCIKCFREAIRARSNKGVE